MTERLHLFHINHEGVFTLKRDVEIFKEHFKNVIKQSLSHGINLLVFPELFMNNSFLDKIKYEIEGSDIILIGGSFYKIKEKNYIVNTSPIITSRGISYTEKITLSKYDNEPCSSHLKKIPGEEILFIESMYGNFIVLICIDITEKSIRDEVASFIERNQKELDFIFIPSANPKSEAFNVPINNYLNDEGLYICYCNLIGKLTDNYCYDGKSSIYGHMQKKFIEDLKRYKFIPKEGYGYKVCELEEYENLLIATFNLRNKGPIFKDANDPNILTLNPKIEPIRIANRHDQIIYMDLKELNSELKIFKEKNYIFNTIHEVIDKTYNSSFAPLYGDELVKTIDNNVQTRPKSGVWIKEIGQGV